MLSVRLLGGLAVINDGVTMAPPRGRCAALLAWLALNRGMQPRSRVAARLWPDVMDESARRSLRTALLDLRAALGPAAAPHLLATRHEIGLGPEVWVDVCEFAAAEAAGRLAEALVLGGAGELLPELDHEWVFEAREKHDLRLATVIERLASEADDRGDAVDAVEFSRRLVALDPLSEEHARSLIRRLALADDRAAALAAYEQHRERLRTELRMAPSAATRALVDEVRGAIVDVDAAPVAPLLPAPLTLAADAGPLVGRAKELAALEAAWKAVADRSPRLCLLTGEPGIGKSRLIAEVARRVAEGAGHVLYGACRESPRPPYGPFVDAISLDLRGLDPETAGGRLGTSAGELARIVPDLADRFGTAAHASSESPEGEQLRLFGAVGDYLQRAARPRALVVIEDIHWAASATLALLSHIVRTASGPVLLVVSSRDVLPDLTTALSTFIADLERLPTVQRIALSGLTEFDVEVLLRSAADTSALDVGRTARMLHRATDGLPLFLREVVRELPADGAVRAVPFNSTVRDHVAARFGRVGDHDGAVLDAAAVLGAEFAAGVCAQVLDRPLPDVLDSLDRAAALGIVVPVPGAAGRFAFTHAVVGEVRYEAIPGGRRMRLHHAAGTVLRASGAPVTDLARHFYAAADLGDRDDAFTYIRRAGELARERFAFADAAVHFEQAAQLAAELPGFGERERCHLAIELGEALHRAGDPRHRAMLLDAAAAARRLDDADLLTRAALALSEQGWTTSARERQDEIVGLAHEALERLPADAAAGRARLMAMIAAAIHLTPEQPRAREIGAEALAVARESGDLHTLGEVLISAHWACFDPLNLEVRLGWVQEACELGERLDKPVVLAHAFRIKGQDCLEMADLAGARAAFDRADRIADELDMPFLRIFVAASRATLATLAGSLDEAERLVADAVAIAGRLGTGIPSGPGRSLRIERGLWERAAAELEPKVASPGAPSVDLAALAMFHARMGDLDAAARQLEPFAATDFAIPARIPHWFSGMVMLADAATWLRDVAAAARIREHLEPVSGRTPWNVFTSLWPIDVSLAQLCVVLGDHTRAHTYLDGAERTCEHKDLAPQRLRIGLYRAWALRDAGEAVDARPALAAAAASPCAGVAREARLMGLVE